MADISALAAALAALKGAKDIAETMIGIRDSAAFQSKMIEFQSKIIDANNATFAAQEERTALLERIEHLKRQVSEFEAWDSHARRYELKSFPPGVHLYVLKADAADGEPPHTICPTCYQNRRRAILQATEPTNGITKYHCNSCKAEYRTGIFSPRPIQQGSYRY